LCLLKMLRNGRRKNGNQLGISWTKLLDDALYVEIDDSFVNTLTSKEKGFFKQCPTRISQTNSSL